MILNVTEQVANLLRQRVSKKSDPSILRDKLFEKIGFLSWCPAERGYQKIRFFEKIGFLSRYQKNRRLKSERHLCITMSALRSSLYTSPFKINLGLLKAAGVQNPYFGRARRPR
jgi:hypothetical protein